MDGNTVITIKTAGSHASNYIDCREGETLLEAMQRQGLPYRAECGGIGTCGKCRVKVLDGILEAGSQDKKVFDEEELCQGLRLACKAYPKMSCTIELVSGAEAGDYEIIAGDIPGKTDQSTVSKDKTVNRRGKSSAHLLTTAAYMIAIDLGTTTLAFRLMEKVSGRQLGTFTAMNPQRAYGADVITRIKASADGKKDELKASIREELSQGIKTLTEHQGIDLSRISRIAIAGNTTMVHLLLGYDCSSLGVYPFTPVNIGIVTTGTKELFDLSENIPVIILPGISAFVGGDITAGLLACGFDRSERLSLLVDLGTNGEMALGNRDQLLVTSTAAGPAFEGGNISCGVGSIPGAITHVTIASSVCRYETIGGKSPVGICGTGVIELVSELLQNGLLDKTGLLTEPLFEKGYRIEQLVFTQKDVRELQLAKAAVRAGIEILVRRYGITYDEIDQVYLAGGFGYQMNIEKAIHIGLLPEELQGKMEAVGNSSLSGAIDYLTDGTAEDRMKQILTTAREQHLSNDKDFNDLYIEHMSF